MTRYAVLIFGYENVERTPECAEELTDAFTAYSETLVSRGAMAGGEALHPTSTATTIRVTDGEPLITDGAYIESKEALGGFYLIEAKDLDTAIELAAACPGAREGYVEVRPCIDFTAPEPSAGDAVSGKA